MFWKDVFSVFFPNYCIGCGVMMNHFEDFLCVNCSHQLKETNYHLLENNPLKAKFFGKLSLAGATSLLYFQKEGVTQRLIHHLKYHRQEKIGQWLGKWLGSQLKHSPYFKNIEVVIPVPIHPDKLKTRGYNQVALFGKEIAHSLGATYLDDVLIKTYSNSAQAQKHWIKRQKQNQSLFKLQNSEKIAGRNILLVDDVITSGATIELCAGELLKSPNIRLSIASMVYVVDF